MPDEIVTNEKGGKGSRVHGRYDLIDGKALERLAQVLEEGARKYAPGNWKLVEQHEHINHALAHLCKCEQGDTTEDHLGHAFCRLMMAIGVEGE